MKSKLGRTSGIYRNRRLDRSSRYQGGVENKISIDGGGINGKTGSIDRGGVDQLSSFYREFRKDFFKEENNKRLMQQK